MEAVRWPSCARGTRTIRMCSFDGAHSEDQHRVPYPRRGRASELGGSISIETCRSMRAVQDHLTYAFTPLSIGLCIHRSTCNRKVLE